MRSPDSGAAGASMCALLREYLKRATSIEPVFGQIKHNRGITRLKRRGSAAARSEWRLISATHNLLKLHNHWIAPAAG